MATYTPVDRTASAAEILTTPNSIQDCRSGGFFVRSQTRPTVQYWTDGTRCTCPDWRERQPAGGCKHMRAVEFHLLTLAAASVEEELPAVAPPPPPTAPRCQHCGQQGSSVVTKLRYCGGKGYVPVQLCQDEADCWSRWDHANGY